jgi:glycosyltransferase involved in cell wall biosynthesis
MSRKIVVVVDSRGVIQPPELNTISRHQGYARSLQMIDSRIEMIILSSCRGRLDDVVSSGFQQLNFKSNPRISLKYISKSFKFLKSIENSEIILVAGDPWESAFNAIFLQQMMRIIVRKSMKVQIQIHADITDDSWRNRSFINRLRSKLAGVTLRHANIVRCVSAEFVDQLGSTYGLDPKTVVAIPVELNLPNAVNHRIEITRPRSIGFAGRLHEDRGVKEFVQLVEVLDKRLERFQVIIAGTGELRDSLLCELNARIGKERVTYLGNVLTEEMKHFWSQIGVFVSLAKSESYGRSIREAVVFGIPVLGVRSSGMNSLVALGIPTVQFINLSSDPEAVASQFSQMLDTPSDFSFQGKLQLESEKNRLALVESWAEMFSS